MAVGGLHTKYVINPRPTLKMMLSTPKKVLYILRANNKLFRFENPKMKAAFEIRANFFPWICAKTRRCKSSKSWIFLSAQEVHNEFS